ncbi:ornithine cyclodeaminase [Paralcaligenes ginsengisoli]
MKTGQVSHRIQTLFLSAQDVAVIVRRKGLEFCFSQLVDVMRADFLRWADFDKSARVARYSPNGVIELMPIADSKTYSFKYVNGHPLNTQLGLPTVMAFGVLADMNTGTLELISELTLTTALRTAAASALAARALARPDCRSMALIGNGAQSEFQALAFHYLLGIRELRLFDPDVEATRKLMRNLRAFDLGLTACDSVGEAVRGADIVTTITAHNGLAEVLDAEMLDAGMHINAVGGDSPGKTELAPSILRRGQVFVEYEPQTRAEGELQRQPGNFAVTELWRVLAGQAKGRVDAQQITIFDSVGFALEDYSALRLMRDLARELEVGQAIGIVPELADPKDLFGYLNLLNNESQRAYIGPLCSQTEKEVCG